MRIPSHVLPCATLLVAIGACGTTEPWRAYDGAAREPHEECLLHLPTVEIEDGARLPPKSAKGQVILRCAGPVSFRPFVQSVDGRPAPRKSDATLVRLLPGEHLLDVALSIERRLTNGVERGTSAPVRITIHAAAGSQRTLRVRPKEIGLVGFSPSGGATYTVVYDLVVE